VFIDETPFYSSSTVSAMLNTAKYQPAPSAHAPHHAQSTTALTLEAKPVTLIARIRSTIEQMNNQYLRGNVLAVELGSNSLNDGCLTAHRIPSARSGIPRVHERVNELPCTFGKRSKHA